MENRNRIALHSRDPQMRMIGKLCLGGDWACAHGDLAALSEIARRLVPCSPEPLRGEIAGLCVLCRDDPERATTVWLRLRNRVLGSVLSS
jgi:hypothetical protein